MVTTKNRLKPYAKPPFLLENRFENNWKKKRRFYKLRQSQFHRSYGRESAPLHGPLPPPPSPDSSSTPASTPWFVSPEPQHSSTTVTSMMNMMDYNFWDTDSHPTPPSSHRYDDSIISYEHSPSFHGGGDFTTHDHYPSHDDHSHGDDDHPIIWHSSSDKNCDCDSDDDKNDDSDDSKDEGPLAKLMKNDLYHTVLIVFAFIGFTTFFMNMMSGLNIGNNSQMPSIMFVGNNDEEDDEEARKFARVKHEVQLNNLMERSARYIEQFQEILSSMSDDGEQ